MSRQTLMAIAMWLVAAGAASGDEIDDVVRRQMAVNHIPGVAVAVVRDGHVDALRSYGEANLEWSAPVTPNTAFQLASATKLFTGVALMRMVERGELSLGDTLDHFFPDAPESWRRITVRHLATHTSGLSDRLATRPDTVQGMVEAAMATPLAYEPGARSQYGFVDFIVLRAIMEQAAGKPLPQIFQDEIIAPLNLRDTRFGHARDANRIRSAAVVPRRASVYAWGEGDQRVSDYLYGELGYAAGGLYSSAQDMAALFVAIDAGRVISRESLRELEQAARLNDGSVGGFGIAWTVRRYHGVPVVGHSGGPALADVLRVGDEQLTIIVLTNQQRLYPLLAESIADQYLPSAREPRRIHDRAPALTRSMMTALTQASEGRLDPALFNDAGRAGAVAFLGDFGAALLEAVGPLESATLLQERAEGDATVRVYAISFRDRLMYWRLVADREGRIIELGPTAEP